MVFLSGEPGIGKTRLASYAAMGANADGFAVCWGACSEDLAAPYEPWIAVCSQLIEHASDEVLAGYVARFGGEVGRLARNFSRRVSNAPGPQSSDPETERFLLFQAVVELLRAVAGSVALCVVLDDFHWADAQSVALLKHLARLVEQGALQVLVTYRDSDLTSDHPLTGALADLYRLQGVQRIALGGLAVDDVAALMAAAAGHELDSDGLELVGEIAAETDGNPFFVGEILRNLTESGMLVFDEATGRWRVDRGSAVALPESIRDVVGRRVERLGEAPRQILTAASVVGRTFDLEVLTELLDRPEEEVLDAIEVAIGSAVLVESFEPVGRFAFTHALINHTLYESLTAARRARMHQRVAQALEDLYGPDSDEHLGELALHWRLATVVVDRPKAAAYAARAGQQALDRLAPAEAARLFGDAVELLGAGDTVERCRVLIGLGAAQRLTGNTAFRETLLDASRIASVLGDAGLAAEAALANSRGLPTVIGDTDREHLAAIERALELDDRSDPARRGRLLGIKAMELNYDPAQAAYRRRLADDAISLAREPANPAALAEVLRYAFHATWSPDTVKLRSDRADELVRAADQAQDPALQFWAAYQEWVISEERGEFDRATDALTREQRLAEELGQPTLRWLACAHTATVELRRGNLAEAERLAERAAQLGQDGDPVNAALYYGAQLAFIRSYQGRGDEVLPMLEQSVAAYPGIPAWRAGLAAAYCWTGSFDQGRAIVQEAASDRFDHIPWDSVRTTALALYAEAAAQSGCTEAAAILYELLEPWADQLATNGALPYGHVRMYLGELADAAGWPERADEHLDFASRFHDEHGMRLWAANSHLAWANSLARRGDRARAREHGAQALELASASGYGEIEKRAAALMSTEVSAET